jgi:hypothetical protein
VRRVTPPVPGSPGRWQRFARFYGLDGTPDSGPQQRRYVVAGWLLAAFAVWIYADRGWRAHGPVLGIVMALLVVLIIGMNYGPWSQRDRLRRWSATHPYVDASFGIPIGLVAAFFFFPHWPVWRCLAVAAAYAALIFGLAYRRQRRSGSAPTLRRE